VAASVAEAERLVAAAAAAAQVARVRSNERPSGGQLRGGTFSRIVRIERK